MGTIKAMPRTNNEAQYWLPLFTSLAINNAKPKPADSSTIQILVKDEAKPTLLIQPEQYFAASEGKEFRGNELSPVFWKEDEIPILCASLIEMHIDQLRDARLRNNQITDEILIWLLDDNRSNPFSFQNCCLITGLDFEALRLGVFTELLEEFTIVKPELVDTIAKILSKLK